MPLADIVAALSWKPAAIAGVADRHGRPIEVGEPANLTVFDPDLEWEVVPARLASKSRNTPFVGTPLRGKVRHTIYDGAARRARRNGYWMSSLVTNPFIGSHEHAVDWMIMQPFSSLRFAR